MNSRSFSQSFDEVSQVSDGLSKQEGDIASLISESWCQFGIMRLPMQQTTTGSFPLLPQPIKQDWVAPPSTTASFSPFPRPVKQDWVVPLAKPDWVIPPAKGWGASVTHQVTSQTAIAGQMTSHGDDHCESFAVGVANKGDILRDKTVAASVTMTTFDKQVANISAQGSVTTNAETGLNKELSLRVDKPSGGSTRVTVGAKLKV